MAIYCGAKRYSRGIERDAVSAALLRWRHGSSPAEAIRAGKVRADFVAQVYGPKGAA